MKKKIFIAALLLCTLLSMQLSTYAAVNESINSEVSAVQITEDTAGSINMETIIKPQYDDAQDFSEGLAAVKVGDKWGFINENNMMVIAPQYAVVGKFNEGKAVVANYISGNYEFGFIDKNNKYTGLYYNDPWDYEWSKFKVSDEDLDYHCSQLGIERNNWFKDEVYKCYFVEGMLTLPTFRGNDKRYIYNSKGECIIDSFWESTTSNWYNNGKIWIVNSDGNIKYKLIDKKGDMLLELNPYINSSADQCTFMGPLGVCDNGDLIVCVEYYDEYMNNFKYAQLAIMDSEINILFEVPCQRYSYKFNESGIHFFNSNVMVIKNNEGLYGGIDPEGKTVIEFKYDDLLIESEGLLAAKESGCNYYGFIDIEGNEVIPAESKDYAFTMASIFSNGIAAVYDEKTQSAYCISRYSKEKNYKIAGSENISLDVYFPDGMNGVIDEVKDYAVIEENGKYGFAKFEAKLDLPSEKEVGSKYYETVCKAINQGIVPNSLQNQFKENTTKAEFDEVVVNAIEMITGSSIEEIVESKLNKTVDEIVAEYPFEDTSNVNTLALYSLGLLPEQPEDGFYRPYADITIGEEAYILDNTLKMILDKSDISLQSTEDIKVSFDNMIELGILSKEDNIADNSIRAYSFATVFNMYSYADTTTNLDKIVDCSIVDFEDEYGNKYSGFAEIPTEIAFVNIKINNKSEENFGLDVYSASFVNAEIIDADYQSAELSVFGEANAKLKLVKSNNAVNKVFIWTNEAIPLTEVIEIK